MLGCRWHERVFVDVIFRLAYRQHQQFSMQCQTQCFKQTGWWTLSTTWTISSHSAPRIRVCACRNGDNEGSGRPIGGSTGRGEEGGPDIEEYIPWYPNRHSGGSAVSRSWSGVAEMVLETGAGVAHWAPPPCSTGCPTWQIIRA